MANMENAIIRSRELKSDGLELTDVDISRDILVKSDTTMILKNNKDNIINGTSVPPKKLKKALQGEKTISLKEFPDDNFNLQYINYKHILNHHIDNDYYRTDFTTVPYTELDEDDSFAILDINDALIINTNNILIDEPIVIKSKNTDSLSETKNKLESADNIKLYSENERLQIEVQQNKEYTLSEAFENEIGNLLLISSIVILFIPISLWAAIISVVFVISLFTEEITKFLNGKSFKTRYFVDYGLSNNCRIDDIVNITKEGYYNLSVTETKSNIIMKANKIDAKWKIDNKGVLPDKFVTLFENIGFENINTNLLNLKVCPAYKTSNVENYILSECGKWCINPKQNIKQNTNSEKVLQFN